MIDDIILSKYNVEKTGITWWDVIRRLTADEFFSIPYEVNPAFWSALSDGWRGIKIREVLNRIEEGLETGIVSTKDESISDTIILNLEDRIAQNY